MKCRYEGHTQAPEQRDVDPIDMGVQHIELARLFGDPRQHCAIGQHWSGLLRSSRNAFGEQGSSFALVTESPEANRATSWPISTSSSGNQKTTRSVPP